MLKKRTSTSNKSVFSLFKKRSKLTYPQIAKLTGLSVSHLKKMGCGKEQISDKVALVLHSRFGIDMECLLNKGKNQKLLSDDGDEWFAFDATPPGTTSDYDSSDVRKAYIKAVEACTKEAGHILPPALDDRFRMAKAIEWFNPSSTNADIDKLNPRMAEPARHVAALYKKWDKRNSIGKEIAEIPLQGYFENRKNEFLITARRTARKDIMELLELLLVDAGYHSQSPLIAEAIIKSISTIRKDYGVQRQGKVPIKKGNVVSDFFTCFPGHDEIEKIAVNGMKFRQRVYEAGK